MARVKEGDMFRRVGPSTRFENGELYEVTSVNSTNGSVWVRGAYDKKHISSDELSRFYFNGTPLTNWKRHDRSETVTDKTTPKVAEYVLVGDFFRYKGPTNTNFFQKGKVYRVSRLDGPNVIVREWNGTSYGVGMCSSGLSIYMKTGEMDACWDKCDGDGRIIIKSAVTPEQVKDSFDKARSADRIVNINKPETVTVACERCGLRVKREKGKEKAFGHALCDYHTEIARKNLAAELLAQRNMFADIEVAAKMDEVKSTNVVKNYKPVPIEKWTPRCASVLMWMPGRWKEHA